MRGWYEFFAGGGLARLGLGPMWDCLCANDCCDKKAAAYRLNFGPSPEFNLQATPLAVDGILYTTAGTYNASWTRTSASRANATSASLRAVSPEMTIERSGVSNR